MQAAEFPTLHRRASPNHDARGFGRRVDAVCLHYTGMVSAQAALDRLCDPAAKVSCHYLIEEDGTAWQLVEEDRRAWHAGVSNWAGQSGLNACSVGIELVNPGHEHGYRPFPDAQIQALLPLLRGLIARHGIAPDRVLGHSDVAPLRKQDPGELFPWARLAAEGLIWHPPADLPPLPRPPQAGWTAALSAWGYDLHPQDPEQVQAVVTAFQRRYHPARIDGMFDDACWARLSWLLARREAR